MKTLDQILMETATKIRAMFRDSEALDPLRLPTQTELKRVVARAIEQAFDSKLEAEMKAQDAWWDEQEAAQEEGWADPDEKADPDCPEEFMEDFTVGNY